MKTKLHSLLVGLALAASLHQALAQSYNAGPPGTAFTYQGRLNNGTNPANGQYDFQFQVFDAATVGASYGSPNPNTVAGVGVSNGLFSTVTLDFGSSVFTGPAPSAANQCADQQRRQLRYAPALAKPSCRCRMPFMPATRRPLEDKPQPLMWPRLVIQ